MASKINAACRAEATRQRRSTRRRRAVMTEQEVRAYLVARETLRRIRHASLFGATGPQALPFSPG